MSWFKATLSSFLGIWRGLCTTRTQDNSSCLGYELSRSHLKANFNDKLNISLQKISLENKICQLMGDLNLDLLKQDRHHDTSAFIDIIYSNGFVPVITKPTRITEHSQTLIDHIYTNTDLTTPNYKHKQGILRNRYIRPLPGFLLNA